MRAFIKGYVEVPLCGSPATTESCYITLKGDFLKPIWQAHTLWQVSLKQHYEIKNTSDAPLGQKLLQPSIIQSLYIQMDIHKCKIFPFEPAVLPQTYDNLEWIISQIEEITLTLVNTYP